MDARSAGKLRTNFFWVLLKFCESESCHINSLAILLKRVLGRCVNSDRINEEVCMGGHYYHNYHIVTLLLILS